MQIAIDGPAAAGKTTLAKKLAEHYKYIYLDTGAMYRCIALQALRQDINIQECPEKVITIAENTDIEFINDQIICNKENVTTTIRTQAVAQGASDVGVIKKLRQILVAKQREYAAKSDIVMEGRDITSVVLPNADIKFYLTADVLERAKRRQHDLAAKQNKQSLSDLMLDIKKRDENDMNRAVDPLIIVPDALVIDTTDKSIGAVFFQMRIGIDAIKYIQEN